MDHQEMDSITNDVFAQVKQLRDTKGKEYATEKDTLADFKEVAAEAGITPLQCWATYVKKHERAIDTFIREGGIKSESIESRIVDVIVYHLLLLGLIRDTESATRCGVPHTLDSLDADRNVEHLHEGEVIVCELMPGHGAVMHYGRTPEGHGFQWPV